MLEQVNADQVDGKETVLEIAADETAAETSDVQAEQDQVDQREGLELIDVVAREEARQEAREEAKQENIPENLDYFHRWEEQRDGTYKCKGPIDIRIFKAIKERGHYFVLNGDNEKGIPYYFSNGVYKAPDADAKIKTEINIRMFEIFQTATNVSRIYRLFLQSEELRKQYGGLNRYPTTWINFRNGMYDAKTGEFIRRYNAFNDPKPETEAEKQLKIQDPYYYALNQIPHYYNPNAKPKGEHIEEWLHFICPSDDDREMLLQFVGLCMTRDVEQQKMLFLKGKGGNGKSVLLNLINRVIGEENISHISLDDMIKSDFAAVELLGKLVNSCGDFKVTPLDDLGPVKRMTGKDPIHANKKYANYVNFNSYCRLIFSVNQLPILKGEQTSAPWRRFLILKMDKVPPKVDVHLEEKLATEIDYFIHLAVDALHRMYISGGEILESESSKREVNLYREKSDSVMAFLDNDEEAIAQCTDSKGRTDRVELYKRYMKYCEDEGRTELSRNNFYDSLRNKGYEEQRSNGVDYFLGIYQGKTSLETSLKSSLETEKLPQELLDDGYRALTDEEEKILPFPKS